MEVMEHSTRPHAATRPARTPFVVVTGGKGGVGKSTVALNLAARLAGRGRRVVLADLDFGLGNLDVMLGREPGPTVEDFARGAALVEDCLVEVSPGLRLLPSSSGTRAMAVPNASRREALIEALTGGLPETDLVIADTSAGIGPDVLGFTAAADYALVVTTHEPTAQADAYGVIKAFDELSIERGGGAPTPELVVNRARDLSQARRVATHLRSVAERFLGRRPALAGWLPETASIPRALARRAPLDDGADALVTDLFGALCDRAERIAAPRLARRSA